MTIMPKKQTHLRIPYVYERERERERENQTQCKCMIRKGKSHNDSQGCTWCGVADFWRLFASHLQGAVSLNPDRTSLVEGWKPVYTRCNAPFWFGAVSSVKTNNQKYLLKKKNSIHIKQSKYSLKKKNIFTIFLKYPHKISQINSQSF